MTDVVSMIRDDRSSRAPGVPKVIDVSTTWLTKRRAVDHCRVHSSLCPTS